MPPPIRRVLLTVACTGALCAVAAAVPLAAQARLIEPQSCPSTVLTQPFAPWGDHSAYELAPRGDFEQAGWRLQDGARRVAGSEPFAATGTLGAHSLSLPAGAWAQSPATCVDAAYPTMRFFDAGTGTVLVQLVDGDITLPLGEMTAGGAWAPSGVMATLAAVPGLLGGGTAQVSLRLTAVTGDPQIDDVFIDPWNRG